jgi:hypothetical protein
VSKSITLCLADSITISSCLRDFVAASNYSRFNVLGFDRASAFSILRLSTNTLCGGLASASRTAFGAWPAPTANAVAGATATPRRRRAETIWTSRQFHHA